MSSSDRQLATIVVEASLGTAITLTDGGFKVVEPQCTTSFRKDVPGGVYTLTLSEGELSRHWIIRVRAGSVWRYPEDVAKQLGEEGTEKNPLENRRRRWVAEQISRLGPVNGSEIVVMVSSLDFEASALLERSIRLGSVNEPSIEPERVVMPDRGDTLIRYEVEPGLHHLGFETFERKRMDQLVFALPQRRVVVLMEYGQASIVVQEGQTKRIRKRRGIDPAKTVIVSQGRREGADDLVDKLRLATILLYLLRTRVKPAEPSIAMRLMGTDADPYLKLYAAVTAIALPGNVVQRLASSIASDGFSDSLGAESAARGLLNDLEPISEWPDVTCLAWRLRREDDDVLTDLPMLEVSWRWAAAHSARWPGRKVMIPEVVSRIVNADAMAAPWLTVGVGRAVTGLPEEAPDEILPELTLIATKVGEALKANEGAVTGGVAAGSAGAFLDSSWLTATTERLVQSIVSTGGAERWASGDSELVPQLAAYLGKPLGMLAQTLKNASEELSKILDVGAEDPNSLWNSDPHKGKFGSRPRKDGAVLEIDMVTERDDYQSLGIHLTVTATPKGRPIEGPVTFYLHPTFSPSVRTVPVVDGVAKLALDAWGAFTVGVETADGRRLELDLAEEAMLPKNFRAR